MIILLHNMNIQLVHHEYIQRSANCLHTRTLLDDRNVYHKIGSKS